MATRSLATVFGDAAVAPQRFNPNSVVAWLKQYTPWEIKTPLTPEEYECVAITMRTRLLAGTTSGQQNFRVRSNHVLLITTIRGHLAFNDLDGETLAITGLGNPDMHDRLFIKAMNCRMDLMNQDRNIKIFEGGQTLPLAQLLPMTGGEPIRFDPPHIVMPGQTIQLDTTLNETAAALVGGSTDYGVQIDGILVRVSP